MSISHGGAAEVYKKHLAERDSADMLQLNLKLGRLDAISEEFANSKLPVKVRLERLEQAAALLQGRNVRSDSDNRSNNSDAPTTPRELVDLFAESCQAVTGEPLSEGEVVFLANMLNRQSPLRVKFNRFGEPIRVAELTQRNHQLEDENRELDDKCTRLEQDNTQLNGRVRQLMDENLQLQLKLSGQALAQPAPVQAPAQGAIPMPAAPTQQPTPGSNAVNNPPAQGGTPPEPPKQDQPGWAKRLRGSFQPKDGE